MLYDNKKVFRNLTLKESQTILQTAIECLPFDVFIINIDGYYAMQNTTCKQHWGDIVGKRPEDVATDKETLATWKNNNSRAFSGETITGEVSFPINGGIYHFYNVISPIYISNEIQYIIGINIDITEKKEAQQKLLESEAKNREIIENLDVGFFQVSLDGIILIHNQKFNEIFGIDPAKRLNGEKSFDFWVDEHDREKFIKDLKKNGKVKNYITVARRINGEKIVLQGNSHIIRDKKGIPIATEGTIIDITEKYNLQKELEESEKRYKDIAELLPDIIFETDLDLNLTYVNSAGFEKFGITKEDVGTKVNLAQFINTYYIEPATKSIKRILEGKETKPQEYLLVKKDGTKFYGLIHSRPIYKNEKIIGIRGTVTDINTLVVAERELKESEDKFRTIAEQSLLGIGILQDDTFKYVNQRFVDIGGNTIEEVKNWGPKEFLNMVHPEDREIVIEQAKKRQLGIDTNNTGYECRCLNKKGEVIWVQNYSKTISFNGKFADLITIIDITDRKHTEQKLKESEKRYRSLFNSSLYFVGLLDTSGILIECNDTANLFFSKHKKDDIIGKSLKEVFSLNSDNRNLIPLFEEELNKLINGNSPRSFDFQLHKSAGGYLWIHLEASIIEIENDKLIQVILQNITEKKEAEQKLIASEEKYRKIFENSPIGLMEQDYSKVKKYIEQLKASGIVDFEKYLDNNPEEVFNFITKVKVIDVNQKILEVYKAESKENYLLRMNSLGENKGNKMTEEIFLDNKKEFLSLIRGDNVYESEISTKNHAEENIYLYAKTSIMPGFEDTWAKVIVSLIEITERRQTEQKLKESEEKFRNIAEQSLMGICIIQDFEIKYLNKQIADIYEYPFSIINQWKPREFLKIIHPDSRDMALEQLTKKQQGASDIITHYNAKIITKNGKVKWVENYSKPITYQGRPADLLTQIDVTPKMIAEQKVRESEEKYRHLYETSPYAILLVNMEGKIADCNVASEKLFGFKKSELIGMNFAHSSFIPKEHIYSVIQDFKKLIKNEIPEPGEIKLYNREGKSIWVLYQASSCKIENEDIIQVIIEDISERKKAAENLKDSEVKYHELFETSPDGVILTDIKGTILECNSAIEKISGYHTSYFIGKNFMSLDLYLDDGLEQIKKGYKDLFGEQILEFIEFPIKTKENKVRWIQIDSNLINMKSQKYIIAVLHDITSVKEAEKALKESEKKFRDILETSSVGVMELDVINKKLLYINPKLITTLGYKEEEINEEIFRNNIIHPNDLVKLLKTNEEAELEFRITDKLGRLKWLAGKRIPHYNNNGKIDSIRIWLDDITEKKMYENLIYELNINFLNFSTNIRKNIDLLLNTCLKLLDGNLLLYVYKSILNDEENYQIITSESKIFNFTSDKFNNLFISTLFHEEHDFPQTFVDIDRMRFGRTDQFMVDHKFKGCFGKVIKSHEGLNSAICIFYKDNPIISGQDKLVLFLISDALEIEQRRWHVQKDLEKQNETLNKINKLKSELFSRTSHELKTPLISIKGFTELLLTLYQSKLDPEIISILGEIKDGSKRLEEIINLLLESTKLEAGQLSLNLQDEDLTFLINFCVKELQGLAKLRNQSIVLNLHQKLETKFDKERIYEVISNLLVNAIKYTPPGGKIIIESKIENDDYEILVKDNGIGFTEEEKELVFNQFGKIERYGQGWDIAADGTGLGLYITKKLVELHEGTIWLESDGRNKGTTFHFTIPIKKIEIKN